MLLAALCDFLILSESGQYGYSSAQLTPTVAEDALFKLRFGQAQAESLLYHAASHSGSELKAKGWTCRILPQGEVADAAEALAVDFAKKSAKALRLLKAHLARKLSAACKALSISKPQAKHESAAGKAHEIASPVKYIELTEKSGPVLHIHLQRGNFGAKALGGYLQSILSEAGEGGHYKAAVLSSAQDNFMPVEGGDIADIISSSALPVVAALSANLQGDNWLVCLGFDAVVHQANGQYSGQGLNNPVAADATFARHFGPVAGKAFMLATSPLTGEALAQKAPWMLLGDVDKALEVAAFWATLDLTALKASWRKPVVKAEQIEVAQGEAVKAPTKLPVDSEVIHATLHPNGVVLVEMADKEARNMFSEAFVTGMADVFEYINQSNQCKVVVLTGYDNYFASGGTKQSLLDIQQGKGKFTDNRAFQIALNCKLPVVSAMQGHGIGAGWAMGMYADLPMMSEQSRYLSPYMGLRLHPGRWRYFHLR